MVLLGESSRFKQKVYLMIAIVVYFTLLLAILGRGIYKIRKETREYTERSDNHVSALKDSIPLDWEIMRDSQVPIATFTFSNGKKYTFLIDSGASHNYLSDTVLKDFEESQLNRGSNAKFFGVDGVEKESGIINFTFTHRNSKFSDEFLTADMRNGLEKLGHEVGTNIHGIIGVSFLRKYGLSIDLSRMLVWKKI